MTWRIRAQQRGVDNGIRGAREQLRSGKRFPGGVIAKDQPEIVARQMDHLSFRAQLLIPGVRVSGHLGVFEMDRRGYRWGPTTARDGLAEKAAQRRHSAPPVRICVSASSQSTSIR